MDGVTGNPGDIEVQATTPQEIFNCRSCSRWLQPGTLVCPECGTIVYAEHLRDLALAAQAQENAQQWPDARATWQKALPWLPPETKQHQAVLERVQLIDQRTSSAAATKAKWTKRLGPFAPVLLFLSKFKTLFFFLTKAKFLLSFVGFFGLYWALFGWKFGLGFTLSIALHEMGHYVAAKRRGLKVDLPIFLPGLGAYVRWYAAGISLYDLSSIALAGPFAGLLVAGACGGIAKGTGETYTHPGLFSALAHLGAWLNIVNLTPVFGLDGAQAAYSLNRTQRLLILATCLIFYALLGEWPFLIVAAGMLWRVFQSDAAPRPSSGTLAKFVLILFALGVVMYLFPDPMRRRY